MKICFYDVDLDYVNHLKKAEISERGFSCVPNIQYNSGKNKFVYGAVLQVNGMNYFVPVSSKEHNKQDDIQIRVKDKVKPIAGTLRFAYMMPIPMECLELHDISKIKDYTEKERCRKELAFCRKNRDRLQKQAELTYSRVKKITDPRYKSNCCDFEILERAYIEFCKQRNIDISNIVITAPAPEHPQAASVEPTQNLSALQEENAALKKELAQATATCDKKTETIRTANAVLAANPQLKKAFVEEKRKLLQQSAPSQQKTAPQPQQPKNGSKPKR